MKPPFIADRQKPTSSRSAAVEQDKLLKEKNLKGENQVATNGGTKLNREACDPDEDTAGRISIAADIFTQVRCKRTLTNRQHNMEKLHKLYNFSPCRKWD